MRPTPMVELGTVSSRGADVTGGNIVYYLQAIDTEGNEGFSPLDGEANPHGFRVNPDA